MALAALTLPLLSVANMTREIMRLSLQPWRYLVSSLLAAVGGALLAVLAVTALDAGREGRDRRHGSSVRRSSRRLRGLVSRTYLHGHYDLDALRRMLRFGLPLIPGLVALWATAYADRLLLADIEDLDAVGLYAIAARFAAPIMLLLTAFVTAYHPFLLRCGSTDAAGERDLRGRMATLVAVALLGAGLPLAVFGPRAHRGSWRPATTTRRWPSARWCSATAAYGVSSVFRRADLLHRRTDVSAAAHADHGRRQRRPLPRADPALRLPRRGARGASAATASWPCSTGGGAGASTTRRTSPCRLLVAFALAAAPARPGASTSTPRALTLLLKLARAAARSWSRCGSRTSCGRPTSAPCAARHGAAAPAQPAA